MRAICYNNNHWSFIEANRHTEAHPVSDGAKVQICMGRLHYNNAVCIYLLPIYTTHQNQSWFQSFRMWQKSKKQTIFKISFH